MTWDVFKNVLTRSALLALLCAPATHASEPATPVIPLPAHVVVNQGAFSFDADTTIVVHGGAEAERIARDFAARIERSRGFAPARRQPEARRAAPSPSRSTRRQSCRATRPITLDVTPHGIQVTASAPAGLFYGAVTLWQLASADGQRGATTIAAQHIEDAPRFAWRGLMLDVARHFRSVDDVKALMASSASLLLPLAPRPWPLAADPVRWPCPSRWASSGAGPSDP